MTTTTYEINVPSGKYSIDLDNKFCVYDAYEYFIENVLSISDIKFCQNIEDFDVFNLVTIIE